MRQETKQLWKTCFCTLILLTIIYICLYFPFLRGDYLYIYSDIGSDTYTTYLPNVIYDIRHILSGESNLYTLVRGLGEYYVSAFSKYLNPFDLSLLLFGEENIHWGILLSLYMKYVSICLFAVLFFRRLFRNNWIAAICALLWTYSGYAVLWGQHYQFLRYMAALTIVLYGLQLFLEGDRKRFLLIPGLAFLAFNSYLWFYTTCYFVAVYSILYLAFHRVNALAIAKRAGIFVSCAICSIAMAGESIVPAISKFFQSSRMADVTGSTTGFSLFSVYSVEYLLSFLARLLLNNTLGIANSFSGPANYYETAILSVSVLFFFSLILLLQSKYRRQVAILTGCCLLALCLPVFSQLLTFNYKGQRWTYLYCFAEIILIGFGLAHLLQERQKPEFHGVLVRSVLITDGVYLGLLALLWFAQRFTGIELSRRACLILVSILILYNLIFLLTLGRKAKHICVLLSGIVCIELLAANYDTVNLRERVTFDDWYNSMYYDSTSDAVAWLSGYDTALYRTNKTYDSAGYNDALIQNYNGMAVYSSTNAAELINLYYTFGYTALFPGLASNWIRFSGDDTIANTLLGVKYVITHQGTELNKSYYRAIYSEEEYTVWENLYWLGFGYLYQDEITEDIWRALDETAQRQALADSYFVTGSASEDTASLAEADAAQYGVYTQTIDLIPYFTEAVWCDASVADNKMSISGTENDQQLYFNCPQIPEGWSIAALTVTLSAEEESMLQLFISVNDSGFSEENSVSVAYSGQGTESCTLSFGYDDITDFRLDPSAIAQNVTIESAELVLINDSLLTQNLGKLQENCMTDFTQQGNVFTGSISSPYEEAMLCIPLIYSEHWTAEVDGKEAEIANINGGLVGISLSAGKHEISLTYRDNAQQIGRMIGLITTLGFLAGALLWWRLKGRKEPAYTFNPISDEPVDGLSSEQP